MNDSSPSHRFGSVALIGRPNVGKSTLMNGLLGQKISIITRRPQTTRHCIHGIITQPQAQMVLVDTPGMQQGSTHALGKTMNRVGSSALEDVDLVVWVTEAGRWQAAEDYLLRLVQQAGQPTVLVINKIDRLQRREAVLPHIDAVRHRHDFAAIVPLCARQKKQVGQLEKLLLGLLPEGEAQYPADMVTDRSERFLAAELVREQLMSTLGQELPYATTVEIERFCDEESGKTVIHALIWVARDTQKAIVIGQHGERIKAMGSRARQQIQHLLERGVELRLWVKVRRNWYDDPRALASLGYGQDA